MDQVARKMPPELSSQMVILPFALSFPEGDVRFFINVQKVVRVIEAGELQAMPSPIKPFEQLLDYQGISVPIIHIKKWLGRVMNTELVNLGKTSDSPNSSPRIVICELLGYYIGVVIDRTYKVAKINIQQVLPAPAIFPGVSEDFVSSMVHDNNGYCYLFDLEAFFEAHDIRLTEVVSENADALQKLKGKSILVVEDSKLYRRILIKALSKHGADVEVAENGKEGLDILKQNLDRFDAIVSDIEMPHMNGIDMIRNYRNSAHSIPYVLFHSSISNETLAQDLTQSELGDFLVKFDEENIVQKIFEGLLNKA